MSLQATPKGNRVHLAVFGRRNVGKSSFINAFIGQEISIVSATPGTTTDPVEKSYELQPFGPVNIIDTAGLDDVGELGEKRIAKTKAVLSRTDFAFLITELNLFGKFEEELLESLQQKKIPCLLVVNKQDETDTKELEKFILELSARKIKALPCSATTKLGISEIKDHVIAQLEKETTTRPIAADLLNKNDVVILVMPQDKEAPQGRLILPEAQTIRELLDHNIPTVSVQLSELDYTLKNVLKDKPKLVITDSQCFKEVSKLVPENILMTSFSILFARQKGDLETYLAGTTKIKELKDGDTILIAELCSHRPIGEDIGRVKIPRWLEKYTGKKLNFEVTAGKDFPSDLSKYALIIQCGGCMVNRTHILSRIKETKEQKVAVTNYGITIAFLNGILERALRPFALKMN
jgi:[FeFe] hydrogenase H-cluster maturation GTPase HydF